MTEHTPNKKYKGQLPIIVGIISSLVFAGGTIWSARIAASAEVQKQVSAVDTQVQVLNKSDSIQDSAIDSINKKLDNLNDNLIQLLIVNGIKPIK